SEPPRRRLAPRSVSPEAGADAGSQDVGNHEPGVVPVARVLRTWIAKPSHQPPIAAGGTVTGHALRPVGVVRPVSSGAPGSAAEPAHARPAVPVTRSLTRTRPGAARKPARRPRQRPQEPRPPPPRPRRPGQARPRAEQQSERQ